MKKKVVLVSNGDFRDEVGRVCWAKQEETLKEVSAALKKLGAEPVLANKYDAKRGHGFITTQAEGSRVFAKIDPEAPVIIVLSCWSYAHHVASNLKVHKGPKLVLGNFDGTWPGLVALLNHSGSLLRMSVEHSRLWTDSFADDPQFMKNLKTWLDKGKIAYSTSHVTPAAKLKIGAGAKALGKKLGADILKNKRILGQLDPGCMGMLNAVLNVGKLAAIGMPVEYLNQSDLLAEMWEVSNKEAKECFDWLKKKGVKFMWGRNAKKELVETQVLEQMKMYIAAGRIYERFGLSAIGIPYQVGLVRCCAASDLPEGMLNNSDRPEIVSKATGKAINPRRPIVHFNEGDIGSGIPQVLMHDILTAKKMAPETTLHDVRWGDEWEGEFVWLFEISGGAPPAHFGGWQKTAIHRQPAMYFPKGGGSCAGVSKPGTITWARVYDNFGELAIDCGTGEVVKLPEAEINRRWNATTKEWPIANAILPGYGRDNLMATHKSNHITICYGDILQELVATAQAIGLPCYVAGDARKKLK